MPFDGSDFHKLRKQISAGDYFEPSKQSGITSYTYHILLYYCPLFYLYYGTQLIYHGGFSFGSE